MDKVRLTHFKHLILREICNVLERTYDQPAEALLQRKSARRNAAYTLSSECAEITDDIDESELEYLLAFKGDARLVDLRYAIDRIKHGEYGRCIICREEIRDEELEEAPTTRLCSACVDKLTGNSMLYPQPSWQDRILLDKNEYWS